MTNVPPFVGDFSDDDIAWFLRHGEKRGVPAGGVLVREGEMPGYVFFVLEGSFLVSSKQQNFPRIGVLGPGEIIGEISYVSGIPPRGSVQAKEDAVVLRIAREDLDRKITEDAGFTARFHRVVSEFAMDRMWKVAPSPPSPAPPDELTNLRVYELIEIMLRGELYCEVPGAGRREDRSSKQDRQKAPERHSPGAADRADASAPDAEDAGDAPGPGPGTP